MDIRNAGSLRTWITCGSYSLLNTLQTSDIDLIELENATGVTFGVASYGEKYHFTRMLTPFSTFWSGINTVSKVFGIRIKRHCFQNKEKLIEWIENTKRNHFFIGPINMSALTYLPLSSQYKCSDHYIAICKNNNKYYITDSEGIPCLQTNLTKLKQMIDISEIMEANGIYNIGTVNIETINKNSTEHKRIILENACLNYCKAEENNQGGKAFLLCADLVKTVPLSNWISPFYYDLNYYMQRKIMFMMVDFDEEILNYKYKEFISNQITLTKQCLYYLYNRNISDCVKILIQMAALESNISELWKGWLV